MVSWAVSTHLATAGQRPWKSRLEPNERQRHAASNATVSAARILGLQLRRLEVRDPQGLGEVFSTIRRERLQALPIVTDGVVFNQRAQIAVKIVKGTVSAARQFTSAGLN